MSSPGLFIAGALVTVIVATAVVLLIYAAVLDGRDARPGRRQEPSVRLTDPSHALPSTNA
jgi:hypothetical protein